jgi:hypothetical protein
VFQETGAWMAELLILPVYQEDYSKNFTLTASNEFGKEVFNINILFELLDEYDGKICTQFFS